MDTKRISIRRATDYTQRGQVKATKTGGARVVDIDETLLKALKAHRGMRGAIALDLVRPGANIFGGLGGELFHPTNITERWRVRILAARRTEELADLPWVTLQGLRHTHATIMLAGGEHPKIVQERLGHSQISTTMDIYSHVTPTMQRSAVERFTLAVEGHN